MQGKTKAIGHQKYSDQRSQFKNDVLQIHLQKTKDKSLNTQCNTFDRTKATDWSECDVINNKDRFRQTRHHRDLWRKRNTVKLLANLQP